MTASFLLVSGSILVTVDIVLLPTQIAPSPAAMPNTLSRPSIRWALRMPGRITDTVASSEFASVYANALPGFFSLNSAPVEMADPLAKEFVGWRQTCEPTIRSTYQILSRGTPNLENETWTASANVINGTETPEAAAERLQKGLASWYAPQQM